jgi:hypothetical protein
MTTRRRDGDGLADDGRADDGRADEGRADEGRADDGEGARGRLARTSDHGGQHDSARSFDVSADDERGAEGWGGGADGVRARRRAPGARRAESAWYIDAALEREAARELEALDAARELEAALELEELEAARELDAALGREEMDRAAYEAFADVFGAFSPSVFLLVDIDGLRSGGFGQYGDLGEALGRVVRHVADVDLAAPMSAEPPPPDNVCAVCLEAFSEIGAREDPEGRRTRRTACGHDFCAPCLSSWLRQSVSCPVCMRDLSREGGLALRDEPGTAGVLSGAGGGTGAGGAGVPDTGAGSLPELYGVLRRARAPASRPPVRQTRFSRPGARGAFPSLVPDPPPPRGGLGSGILGAGGFAGSRGAGGLGMGAGGLGMGAGGLGMGAGDPAHLADAAYHFTALARILGGFGAGR